MAIATTTALLIGAGIKAGMDVYSAKKGSDAAKKAAAQQTAAADQAMEFNKDIYAPWVSTGGAAATTLGSLMGLPAGPGMGGAAPNPNALSANGGPRELFPGTEGTDWNGLSMPKGNEPWAQQMRAAAGKTDMETRYPWVNSRMGDVTPDGQAKSSFARMRSPDGEEDDVPSSFVPDFESEGFQRVS